MKGKLWFSRWFLGALKSDGVVSGETSGVAPAEKQTGSWKCDRLEGVTVRAAAGNRK